MNIENVQAQATVKPQLPKARVDVEPSVISLKESIKDVALQDTKKVELPTGSKDAAALGDRSIELDIDKVKELAEAFNSFMLAFDQKFQFSVYEDTNQVLVRITDMETDEVIREIPSKETLALAAKIRDFVGLLVDKQA